MSVHEVVGEVNLDTTGPEIILAAMNHDLDGLRRLLKIGSANSRDEDTGTTPLHAAVSACEDEDSSTEAAAVSTIKLLFENGAIWNDLDINNETPGCVALRLELKDAYKTIVDAGVRAELLLNRLDEFQVLGDEDDEGEEEDEAHAEEFPGAGHDTQIGTVNGETKPHTNGHAEDQKNEAGLPVPQLTRTDADGQAADPEVTSARYLASELTFGGDRLLDADDNGVMMAWETDLMRRSTAALISGPGKRVLNVGHGMGIIDGIIQERAPAEHHIIEAHPAVLERMRADGWHERPGVVVHEGRWQDKVGELVASGLQFDAIYFDTFAEDYKALKEFFSEFVISLLDTEGLFGFFNGLGADRQVCYDVYTNIVEMDLFEAGLDTDWEDVKIADLDGASEWEGVRRKYWALQVYRLPTCKFVG